VSSLPSGRLTVGFAVTSNWMVVVHCHIATRCPYVIQYHSPHFSMCLVPYFHLSPIAHRSSPVHVDRHPLSLIVARHRHPPAVTLFIMRHPKPNHPIVTHKQTNGQFCSHLSTSSKAIVFVQVSAMKIHFCFVIMFFQLVASLRSEAKASLRLRSTAGAKPKAGHDERDLAKTKVVTAKAVTVNVVEPQQIVCPGGAPADSSGKCCGVGETTMNGVCCPVGVTATSSYYGQCCAPGQIAASNMWGYTFCCPPETKVTSHEGKCCDASVTVAKLFCEYW
jgi:hypothetical protein